MRYNKYVYIPDRKILDKYAQVLINFALGGGYGVKKGEVVFLQVPEAAKPLLFSLRRVVLQAGAFPITEFIPDGYSKEFYEWASDDQINFFPKKYIRGEIDQMDHVVMIIADTDKYELKGVDPGKIMKRGVAQNLYYEWRDEKENRGKLTWTIGLYGTPALAKDVGMDLEDYWGQIIKGCYLDSSDPIIKWKETFGEIKRLRGKLNSLDIRNLHITAPETDLVIGIDKNRTWLGGDGRNIPSFEIFISPDRTKTEGLISFSEPLYRYGNVTRDIKLEFKEGRVVNFEASAGKELLGQMIATKGADMVGEFSLTDNRFSNISHFMGETLFDENIGGRFGNTHLALGNAYKESYPGDIPRVTKIEWLKMGYNDSPVHTDIISTTDRTVTAKLSDGTEIVIYKNGRFTL